MYDKPNEIVVHIKYFCAIAYLCLLYVRLLSGAFRCYWSHCQVDDVAVVMVWSVLMWKQKSTKSKNSCACRTVIKTDQMLKFNFAFFYKNGKAFVKTMERFSFDRFNQSLFIFVMRVCVWLSLPIYIYFMIDCWFKILNYEQNFHWRSFKLFASRQLPAQGKVITFSITWVQTFTVSNFH